MDPQTLIDQLCLKPHPEGGYFAETYRGESNYSTAIYYLLTAGDVSAMHRIASDEIFHFYAGDPVRMLQLHSDGGGEEIVIGARVDQGERPQVVVPGGTWQGLSLVDNGRFALLGCTVAPGFDFADFEIAKTDELAAEYPKWANRVRELARYDMNERAL